MKAMLLAAGRSSRLGTLGQTLPKPLVPVCGYPAIQFGIAACARAGIEDIVVNLHHHGDLLRDALGDGGRFGVHIAYSVETELLGTGGGLAHARSLLGEGPVLVMNAKVVADIDLGAVIAGHLASGADATLVLREVPDPRTWGAIAADAAGDIVGILDARAPRTPRGSVAEHMFTGIHVVGPAVLDRLRPILCDSIRDGYIPALKAGSPLRAIVLPGYFAEHSTPERYLEGNLALLRRPELIPHPPGPLTGIDASAKVDASANLVLPVRVLPQAVIETGATVGPDVVVGAGATVSAGAHITRSVVWSGARVDGHVHDTVVMA